MSAILGSVTISIFSLLCFGLFIAKLRYGFKKRKFHVFSYLLVVLFSFNFVVRGFFFLSDVGNKQANLKSKMGAFLMCYPSLNMVVATFSATHVWTYDFMIF